jgi:hypothetical protein
MAARATRRTCLLAITLLTCQLARADCYSRDGTYIEIVFEHTSPDCHVSGVFAMDSKNYTGSSAPIQCGRGSNNCCMPGQKCGSSLLCIASNNPNSMSRQYCSNKDWEGCSNLLPGLYTPRETPQPRILTAGCRDCRSQCLGPTMWKQCRVL